MAVMTKRNGLLFLAMFGCITFGYLLGVRDCNTRDNGQLKPGDVVIVERPVDVVGEIDGPYGRLHRNETTHLRVVKIRGEATVPPKGEIPWCITLGQKSYVAIPVTP